MTARVLVGTSGYSYPGWRGLFYPEDLPRTRELGYAASVFDSIEINRSFYALLSPKACLEWYAQTPADFVFSLKGSQFITHSKKLRDVQTALANFFASGVLALEDKLGPIVWQLPRTFAFDEERIEAFFSLLPRTTREAARLAKKHDERVKRGAYTQVRHDLPLRHVLEPRHDSFHVPEFARLARRQDFAIALTDSPDWPHIEEVTTSFMYLRLHGSEKLYASAYRDDELARWSARIAAWSSGSEPADARRISKLAVPRRRSRDVYVYFDNDYQAYAAADARRLKQRLSASLLSARLPGRGNARSPSP